jgi:hypothetical protein
MLCVLFRDGVGPGPEPMNTGLCLIPRGTCFGIPGWLATPTPRNDGDVYSPATGVAIPGGRADGS